MSTESVIVLPLTDLRTTRVDDFEEDAPLTAADLEAIRCLDLTSCDFVGDYGCCDADCPRCHSPFRLENLRTLGKNLATAAWLCESWRLRDGDPAWRPGINIEAANR